MKIKKIEIGSNFRGYDCEGKKINGRIEKELINTFIVIDNKLNRYIVKKTI